MIAAKSQDANFSSLMEDLRNKFANLDTQNQTKILELLKFVQEERVSMGIEYVAEEASEERKLYNKQLEGAENDLKSMCSKLGPIFKEGSVLPPEVNQVIKDSKKEILNTNLFSGIVKKDRFGQDKRYTFSERVEYLMTQARMQNGVYTVDANHEAIKDLWLARKKAQYDSIMAYAMYGKRTTKLDEICKTILSNKTKDGEDVKYPFTEAEVRAAHVALESKKPTR